MKQDLLTFKHWTPTKANELLTLAQDIKQRPNLYANALKGQSIVGLFEKPSLRTRVSFDIGINKMGGHFLYLDMLDGQLSGRESIQDIAANLGCWADAIVARVFKHDSLQTLAKNSPVPVVNALCDLYHPCQALADFLALKETYGELKGIHLVYVGDGNNVAHSLMIMGALSGASITVATPAGYEPDAALSAYCQQLAEQQGGKVAVTTDLNAVQQADVIYTDTWISMGDDTPLSDIKALFHPFQVNHDLVQQWGAKYVMHCQPAHRELEISSEVMDSDKSLLLMQAENRMHAQNAILLTLLNKI